MVYVYLITNTANGKGYVGITKNAHKRWLGHKRDRGDAPLYKAMRKHGTDAFRFDVIETCEDRVAASQQERFWIWYLKAYAGVELYNLTSGGENTWAFTDDVRRRMSASHIGKRNLLSDAQKAQASARWQARWAAMSDEQRRHHVSNVGRKPGFKHSEETKAKMAEARRAWHARNGRAT